MNDFLSTFPSVLLSSDKISGIAQVMSAEFERLFSVIPIAGVNNSIDEIPEEALDQLAFDLGIPWWRPNSSIEEKRSVLKSAWHDFSRIGTPEAINKVIQDYVGSGTVQPWYEYNGNPNHFRITGSNPEYIEQDLSEFLRVLDSVKRGSQALDTYLDIFLLDPDGNYLTDDDGNYYVI